MKRTFKLSMILLFAGIVMVSCNKSSDEIATPDAMKGSDIAAFFQTPQGQIALDEFASEYKKNVPVTKGSEFITPFFSSAGFGVIDFATWEIGFFSDDYDENDFWRVNPDGTTSVHLASNTALGEYMNLTDGTYAYGMNSHLSINYTGLFTSFDIIDPVTGELIFTIYYFDTSYASSAYVMSGNGKVQVDGEGPKMNLKAKVLFTSSGQGQVTLSIN